jgi:hypothetical protein
MGRIAWIAVALVLLTAAPAAQAGVLGAVERAAKAAGERAAKDAAEEAAKAGTKGAEAAANGVKIENKFGGVEATGATVEANGVKIAPGGDGGGDDDGAPGWFYVLFAVGVGGWLFVKFRGKRA